VPSAQYPTIQAAINGVPNGETINVQPGVYYEALFIGPGRSVTIRGIAGPADLVDRLEHYRRAVAPGDRGRAIGGVVVAHHELRGPAAGGSNA
jgi:hypothetical protein